MPITDERKRAYYENRLPQSTKFIFFNFVTDKPHIIIKTHRIRYAFWQIQSNDNGTYTLQGVFLGYNYLSFSLLRRLVPGAAISPCYGRLAYYEDDLPEKAIYGIYGQRPLANKYIFKSTKGSDESENRYSKYYMKYNAKFYELENQFWKNTNPFPPCIPPPILCPFNPPSDLTNPSSCPSSPSIDETKPISPPSSPSST